jgi:hypothetical protein
MLVYVGTAWFSYAMAGSAVLLAGVIQYFAYARAWADAGNGV